jgi:hypothetical protein
MFGFVVQRNHTSLVHRLIVLCALVRFIYISLKKIFRLVDAGLGKLFPLAILIACFRESFTLLEGYPFRIINLRMKALLTNLGVLTIVWSFVSWFKLGSFTHGKTSSAKWISMLLL